MKSRWISSNPKEFVPGDIICNRDKQNFLRMVVYKDDVALWCVGFIHCAFTENNDNHPIFPIYFDEINAGIWQELIRLGNISDYNSYISRIEGEVIHAIKRIEGYFENPCTTMN